MTRFAIKLTTKMFVFLIFCVLIPLVFGFSPFLYIWTLAGFPANLDQAINDPWTSRKIIQSVIFLGGFPLWAGLWHFWDLCVWPSPKIGAEFQRNSQPEHVTIEYVVEFLLLFPGSIVLVGVIANLAYLDADVASKPNYIDIGTVIVTVLFILAILDFVIITPKNRFLFKGDKIRDTRGAR